MAHTKVTKTYSQNTGTANTFSYSGSFDVFKATEVVALLDNVALTYTASTINESASPREYSVDTTAKTIHIGGADLSSGTIIIRPETDMGAPTPRATYTPGASITSADLNNNQKQLMRKCMEYDETLLSTTGGTMTGDLTMGEDTTLIFEGATDDAYETTLTVADPTADRTITIPNVTGTVVTTGDTGTVAHAMLAGDAVDGDNIADDSINSEHIADGSVDLAHMSANSVDSDQYVDGSIDHVHLANDIIDGDNIQDDVINSEHIAAGAVDLEHMSANSVDSDQYVDGSIDLAHMSANSVDSDQYVDGSIDHVHLAADAVDGDNIADNSIDSEHYVDGSIDNEHLADDAVGADELAANAVVNASIAAGAAIAHSKLANVTDGQILVGNGSNVPTAVAVSGDVTIANTGAVTIANDAVEIGMIGCEQTTISDSDSHIPTSGAVVDYVSSVIAPIGGLEVIADDESFPNTIPAAGVVISITDAAGLQVNSSGVSTNGDALDNSTITINGFPSELRGGVGSNPDPYVFQSGAGLMVVSTGSSQTYNYHQAMIRESDFVQLSDDINDFNNRYRVAAGEPGSDNDEGDLVFDTNANKMKVYDGSSWGEVTSTGDFKYLVLCNAGTTNAATYGSASSFDLKETSTSGSAASVTSAAQLIVSVNGVIQKASTGTSAPAEGFAMSDADTIIFSAVPPANSSVFVVQIGSAVSIPTPGDGTVSAAKIAAGAVIAAKIGTGAVEHAKLAADAVDGDNLADNACDSEHYTDGSIDHVHLANDCVDADNIDDNAVNLAAMEHGTQGDILYYGSGGAPTRLGAGTDGYFLKTQGGSANPVWAESGGTFTLDGDNNLFAGTNAGNVGTWSGATHNFCAGYDAGTDLTNGDNNIFIGRNAAMNATEAVENVVIGDGAWENVTSAHRNVVVGHNACQDFEAGWGNENVFIGADAGKEVTRGAGWVVIGGYAADKGVGTGSGGSANNTIIGYAAARDITSGVDNTLIGMNADDEITTGSYNTMVGSMVGNKNETGSNNTCVGYNAMGETGADADKNTCIGQNTGTSITAGGNNTFLGYRAGSAQSPGGGSNTSDTIILGDNDVTALYCADTSISSSDQRDKTDITNFTPGLSFVKDLRPVTYRWDKRSWYNEYNASDQLVKENTPDGSKKKTKQHIGFLAQEVLKVEQDHGFADSKDNMLTVNLQADDYAYGIKYERLIPVLVNAIKELEAKVAALEAK